MKHFDILSAPLDGAHLIEADAGTGKTYSIASMYLRLLLERELTVDRILVLTYTRAATLELKERIRARLIQMKQALAHSDHQDDKLLEHLLKEARGRRKILNWSFALETALADFDNANIYNFHQFCQKVIKDYAVETGGLFDAEILPDNSPFLELAADDFWRKTVYHATPVLAAYLDDNFGPDKLRGLVRTVSSHNAGDDENVFPPVQAFDSAALERAVQVMEKHFREIQNLWILERSEILRLLDADDLNKKTYGGFRQTVAAGLDAFTRQLLPYPLPQGFEKLTSEGLKSKTNKGRRTPEHRFFEVWQAMAQTWEAFTKLAGAYMHNLKVEAYSYITTEMQVQKSLQNKLDFNDLILLVGRAVLKSNDKTLKLLLSQSFDAVMVDEFQDTDPLQYNLFSSLFADIKHLFFMIGDPKQAIYGFRGADVYSYFQAARDTRSAFTLTTNWRSTANLIHGVNQLFRCRKNHPFIANEIRFNGAIANERITPRFAGPPLIFWYLDSRRPELGSRACGSTKEPDTRISAENAAEAVSCATAREILRLLRDEGLAPKDIAVLVNTNPQGMRIAKALAQLNIPATISSDQKVFQTAEAKEMQGLIEGLAAPENMPKLRAAYATGLLGGVSPEYAETPANEVLWLMRLQKMRDWHRLFANYGFLGTFLNIIFSENSFTRLLQASDGRRKVTNFIHLAELLHTAAQTLNLTLSGIGRYLQQAALAGGGEDSDLRLETDDDVVQIVTVHKSKGLEYEVVFYPFGWEGVRVDRSPGVYKYHSPEGAGFDFDYESSAYAEFMQESQAEKLRLLYVALTRARHRCYVGYGRVRTWGSSTTEKFETAALTYLLFSEDLNPVQAPPVEALRQAFKSPVYNDERLKGALETLAKANFHSISVTDVPLGSVLGNYEPPTGQAAQLRVLERSLFTNWRVTSFSSLTRLSAESDDIFEGRDLEQDEAVADDFTLELVAPEPYSIFELPKGAHVGNFFHDLLENLDFNVAARSVPTDLVLDKLREYNLNELFAPALVELVHNLLNTNLTQRGDRVVLKDVRNLWKEMEFYFPLSLVTARELSALFSVDTACDLPESFVRQSAKFTFAPVEGYLKGFIDLAFGHNGRYYIADWKSNYEGAHISAYHHDKLRHTVATHSYFLQYYLYTLALSQYLRLKQPDFNYERDFGGIFYIFLRGFAHKQGPGDDFGVFRDRPPLTLVNKLGRLLIRNFEEFEA